MRSAIAQLSTSLYTVLSLAKLPQMRTVGLRWHVGKGTGAAAGFGGLGERRAFDLMQILPVSSLQQWVGSDGTLQCLMLAENIAK